MRVRMKIRIGGTRDGYEWPAVGGEIDLPDQEAADLIAVDYAEPAAVTVGDSAPEPEAEPSGTVVGAENITPPARGRRKG